MDRVYLEPRKDPFSSYSIVFMYMYLFNGCFQALRKITSWSFIIMSVSVHLKGECFMVIVTW